MSLPTCPIRHPRLWLLGVLLTAGLSLPVLGSFV
jgi:hypothetical protein